VGGGVDSGEGDEVGAVETATSAGSPMEGL
jgi:hypothetical protein